MCYIYIVYYWVVPWNSVLAELLRQAQPAVGDVITLHAAPVPAPVAGKGKRKGLPAKTQVPTIHITLKRLQPLASSEDEDEEGWGYPPKRRVMKRKSQQAYTTGAAGGNCAIDMGMGRNVKERHDPCFKMQKPINKAEHKSKYLATEPHWAKLGGSINRPVQLQYEDKVYEARFAITGRLLAPGELRLLLLLLFVFELHISRWLGF